jgi:hypothetical protein
MKLSGGWVLSIGLALAATGANAQTYQTGNSPYRAVSDIGGPYAAMPEEMPAPGYARPLLPPNEVYTVLRENGFSPLGAPQQHGMFYAIAVIDRYGEDGRLVIDARNGRIVRYVPAYVARGFYDRFAYGPLPPMANLRDAPRPPASVPQVASRTPPVPKPSPLTAKPAPEPSQQSAAVTPKPADPPPAPQTPPPAVEAKPAPQVAPTQPMPKVQGLD